MAIFIIVRAKAELACLEVFNRYVNYQKINLMYLRVNDDFIAHDSTKKQIR